METLFLVLITSLLAVFAAETVQKRRQFLDQGKS
jgi:hypothetical protein